LLPARSGFAVSLQHPSWRGSAIGWETSTRRETSSEASDGSRRQSMRKPGGQSYGSPGAHHVRTLQAPRGRLTPSRPDNFLFEDPPATLRLEHCELPIEVLTGCGHTLIAGVLRVCTKCAGARERERERERETVTPPSRTTFTKRHPSLRIDHKKIVKL